MQRLKRNEAVVEQPRQVKQEPASTVINTAVNSGKQSVAQRAVPNRVLVEESKEDEPMAGEATAAEERLPPPVVEAD